jgi:beta-glucosidase
MGGATIKGYQGQKLGDQQIVGCLKHFLAYSDPKFGKDRTNAWIPEHYLREYHLPSFRAAIDAGARTVMVNSALINGVPTHMNGYLLNDLLKKELKFSGLVVTDWQDIDNLFKYRQDKDVSTILNDIATYCKVDVDDISYTTNFSKEGKLIPVLPEEPLSLAPNKFC